MASSAVPQREADLLHLRLAAARGRSGARTALQAELRHRETVDGAAAAVAAVLLLGGSGGAGGGREGGRGRGRTSDGGVRSSFSSSAAPSEVSRRLAEDLVRIHGASSSSKSSPEAAVAALVEAPLPLRRRKTTTTTTDSKREALAAPPPLPVVDDFDCLRADVRAFTESPGCASPSSSSSSQFALCHSRLVARACNAGVAAGELAGMIEVACAGAAATTTGVVSA